MVRVEMTGGLQHAVGSCNRTFPNWKRILSTSIVDTSCLDVSVHVWSLRVQQDEAVQTTTTV